jgi:biotin transport system substrate-specific component
MLNPPEVNFTKLDAIISAHNCFLVAKSLLCRNKLAEEWCDMNLNNLATMQSIFWSKNDRILKQLCFALMGVFVLAFASQLSIPLKPVPLTFQSVTVILLGMAYGSRLGSYTIALYLLFGLVGFPVFAGFSSGPPVFFGPTCGYLIGFLPAAYISGYLAQKGWAKNILTSFIAACLGVSVIFLLGVSILSQSIGWHHAIMFGLMPFIISESIKLLAISCVIPRLWKKT